MELTIAASNDHHTLIWIIQIVVGWIIIATIAENERKIIHPRCSDELMRSHFTGKFWSAATTHLISSDCAFSPNQIAYDWLNLIYIELRH